MSIRYFAETDSFIDTYSMGSDGNTVTYEQFVCALVKEMGEHQLNMTHMALGITGEAGELADAIKKHWAYGKPLDIENVKEELGDLEFYMAGLRQLVGLSREEILTYNVTKLQNRYPTGNYTDADAIARNDKQQELVGLKVIDVTDPMYIYDGSDDK